MNPKSDYIGAILFDIYYKIVKNDIIVVLDTSVGKLLINDLSLIKNNKALNLENFSAYLPYNHLKYKHKILGIKVNYMERDVRIKLDKGVFITIFKVSHLDSNEYYELDIFFPSDVNSDFSEAYENDSEEIRIENS